MAKSHRITTLLATLFWIGVFGMPAVSISYGKGPGILGSLKRLVIGESEPRDRTTVDNRDRTTVDNRDRTVDEVCNDVKKGENTILYERCRQRVQVRSDQQRPAPQEVQSKLPEPEVRQPRKQAVESEAMQAKDTLVREKDRTIQEQGAKLAAKDAQLRDAETKIAELEQRNKDQQKQVDDLNAQLNQQKKAEAANAPPAPQKGEPKPPRKEVRQPPRQRQNPQKKVVRQPPPPKQPEAAQRQSPVVNKRRNEARVFYEAAEILYNQGEYDLAIIEYQKVISYYDSDPLVPQVLLKQGMAFEKLGDVDTAKLVYRKLLHEYEDKGSPEASRARERLNRLKGRLDMPPPAAGQPWTNTIGMEFVPIPAGTFMMGCTSEAESCDDDEKPRHQVTISRPFHLGKYEVTQVQWESVMGSKPSDFKGSDRPVENVSWNDVQEFIRKLNEKEGHNRYRLPTEAEWEYAARAGSTTAYSFGDDAGQLGGYAWNGGNSGYETHPVGQKQPNAWGLYDMHGNVAEWVQDRYGKYSSEAAVDPRGPSAGVYRVLRNCSWYTWDRARTCRLATRSFWPDNASTGITGFRLALSPRH